MLSGREIKNRLGSDIIIEPFDEKRLNPNSYNLRLHDELLVYEDSLLDSKKQNKTIKIKIPKTGFILMPNQLYLGRTIEYTKTTGLVPALSGRSSTGRLGIFIHITAGFGDVGFSGYWTLELACIKPVQVYPETEICQICYHQIQGEYDSYQGKYQNNKGVQSSRMFLDYKESK